MTEFGLLMICFSQTQTVGRALKFLDAHSSGFQALSSFLIVLLTAAYIWYSRKLTLEAIATRRAQDNPYLLITLTASVVPALTRGGRSVPSRIDVTVRNGGRGPAKNVRIEVGGLPEVFEVQEYAFIGALEYVEASLGVRRTAADSPVLDGCYVSISYSDLFDEVWSSSLQLSWLLGEADAETRLLELVAGAFSVKRPSRR